MTTDGATLERGFRALLRSRGLRRAAAAGCVLFIAIQFVRPELPNPPVVADLEAPPEVRQVLRNACYDCHSNETKIRWFDLPEPVYWKVTEDVLQGRQHLNFSSFGRLRVAQQSALLYESVNQIRLGAMPPVAYTLAHRSAIVTPDRLALLERYLSRKVLARETSQLPLVAASAMFPSRRDVPTALNGVAFAPGYATWQAVTTTDRFDNGTVRVVLANDRAIRALEANQISPWPDDVAFAKVAWNAAADGSGVVRPRSFRQVELMVKGAARYASTQGWGWGRWLGADLTPYGETPAFTSECTGCHAPMRKNDFVFTMPIGKAAARPDRVNAEALPADDFTRAPMEWQVITVSLDERAATMSTVYGNAVATEHLREATPGPYLAGAALARVTWSEREDPHWFGARIPGRVFSIRRINVGATAEGLPTYDCEDRGAGVKGQGRARCPPGAVDALLDRASASEPPPSGSVH
jgi:hypothetical protein